MLHLIISSLLWAEIISALLGYSPERVSAYLTRPENLAWLFVTRNQIATWRVLSVTATDVGNADNRGRHGSPELVGFSLSQKEGHGSVNTAKLLTSFGSNYTRR